LSFFDIAFGIKSIVYIISLSATVIFSIVDGLNATNLNLSVINDWLSYIPLFNIGMGWLVPAIIGAIIGYIISNFKTGK
jgi:branched-chain amino acid:cation transporter, LIVCS family